MKKQMDIKHTINRPAQILVVEDNSDDVELLRIGLERSELPFTLHHARDGVGCMTFLRNEGEYARAPTPDLIFLDLNMPRKNGREVLIEMIADDGLCHLPVIVLSTSLEDEEVLKMYKLGCRSYIVKPVDFDRFSEVVRSLVEYWFTVASLPPEISKTKAMVNPHS